MDNPDSWYNEGNVKMKEGKNEDAITSYTKATDLNPSHISAWNNKGIAMHRLKRYEEAIICYDKVIEIDPDHANAWYNKANALRGLGNSYLNKANDDRSGAAKLINKALAFFDSADACYDNGESLSRKGTEQKNEKINDF